MPGRLTRIRAVIAAGTALSNIIDLSDHRVLAIDMPAAWDAAAITFAAEAESDDTGTPAPTFDPVYNTSGTEMSVTTAASRYVLLHNSIIPLFDGIKRCKLRSGTVAAPVNQTADRTIILVCEPR